VHLGPKCSCGAFARINTKGQYDRSAFNIQLALKINEILFSRGSASRLRCSNAKGFYLHTGCRKGEALNLTWEDVDLDEHKVITIRESKSGESRIMPGTGRSSKPCQEP